MSHRLSIEALEAVLQLAEEKKKYARERAAYVRPGGIAGVFSRPPRDPYPDIDRAEVRNLLADASRAVYPDLNTSRPSKGDPEGNKVSFTYDLDSDGGISASYHERSTRYFHDEPLRFEHGRGLVHAYSRSDDPQQEVRNRSLAYSRAMEGRLFNDNQNPDNRFFGLREKALDEARTAIQSVQMKFKPQEVLRYVKQIRDFSNEYRQEAARQEALRVEESRRSGVSSLDSYMDAYLRKEEIARKAYGNGRCDAEELARFKALDSALSRYENSGGLAADINAATSPVFPSEDVMDLARKNWQYVHASESLEPEYAQAFYVSYAALARQNGAKEEDILKNIHADAQRSGFADVNGLYDSFDNAARKAVRATDDMKVHGLREYLDHLAGNGVSELTPGLRSDAKMGFSIQISGTVDRVTGVSRGESFLLSVDQHLRTPYGTEHDAAVVGRLMEQWNSAVDSRDVASALIVRKGGSLGDTAVVLVSADVEKGRNAVRSEQFTQKGGSLEEVVGEIRRMPKGNNAVIGIVAEEMAAAAFNIKETSPQNLGRALREMGFVSYGGDASAADDFMHAARKLYGNGTAEDAKRVTSFRESFSKEISEGKKNIPRQTFRASVGMKEKHQVKM